MKKSMLETFLEPLKKPHESVCQFAQCKQAVTMCLEVSRLKQWIMHQLARGYCSAQPVIARPEGITMSVYDRNEKMW